jgi:hypothetical protein
MIKPNSEVLRTFSSRLRSRRNIFEPKGELLSQGENRSFRLRLCFLLSKD